MDAIAKELAEVTSLDFSKHRLAQLNVKSLILDLIHHRDVVALLLSGKCSSSSDWLWQKQLRYYCDPEGAVAVKMVDASFKYSWEYQGNAPKLVYTPLIDKCYLTLTQGMALGYGGNPYGPAGTGKTESVKALGQVHCFLSAPDL
jgi:dynein heavy chain 2, cytosolic